MPVGTHIPLQHISCQIAMVFKLIFLSPSLRSRLKTFVDTGQDVHVTDYFSRRCTHVL